MRFENVTDFEIYVGRLKQFPVQIDQFIASFRLGVSSGYTCSTHQVRGIEKQLDAILGSDLPDFRAPMLLETTPEILLESPALVAEIESCLAEGGPVKSGFRAFRDFFTAEYLGACRTNPSISSLPNGAAIYDACLRFHTTTTLNADEIHEIGLKEVSAIESRYKNDVMIPLGFDPEDFPAFIAHTKGTKEYFVSSTEALLDHYRAACAAIEKVLPKYFAEFPRSPLMITSKMQGTY